MCFYAMYLRDAVMADLRESIWNLAIQPRKTYGHYQHMAAPTHRVTWHIVHMTYKITQQA